MSFKAFVKLTLVSIFLIIVAGSVVRMTGSGMGCPDWPKCFGLLVPPTQVEEIAWGENKTFSKGQMIIYEEQLWSASHDFVSADSYDAGNWVLYTKHDYAEFNPAHTWTEYINRLVGALSGVLTFIMLIKSFRLWRTKRKVVYLSALIVFLMGFEAWLGATVVYSVLQPVQITIHMLVALLIVALMVYLLYEIPDKTKAYYAYKYDGKLNKLLVFAIVLSLVQIAMGTQVRQLIDEISSSLDYSQRELWIGLAGLKFKIHRSFAIVLVVCNVLLWLRLRYLRQGLKLANALILIVLVEVLSGVVLTYANMMPLMQPIHLLAGSVMFVLQIAMYFQFRAVKTI